MMLLNFLHGHSWKRSLSSSERCISPVEEETIPRLSLANHWISKSPCDLIISILTVEVIKRSKDQKIKCIKCIKYIAISRLAKALMMFRIFLPPVALCLREHRPSRQPFHEPEFNFFITIVHYNEKRTILGDSCVVVTMSPVSPKDAIQAQPVAHRFLWMFQYIFNSGWIVGACNGTKGRVLFPTDLQLIVKGKHFVRREHQPSDNISFGPLNLI